MKVIKRVPITLAHVEVLVDYGFYVGYRAAVKSSPFSEAIKDDFCAMAYETYMKPVGNALRRILGVENGVAIDLYGREIAILDAMPGEINYRNAQDVEEEGSSDE